jgi:hypothetical protein
MRASNAAARSAVSRPALRDQPAGSAKLAHPAHERSADWEIGDTAGWSRKAGCGTSAQEAYKAQGGAQRRRRFRARWDRPRPKRCRAAPTTAAPAGQPTSGRTLASQNRRGCSGGGERNFPNFLQFPGRTKNLTKQRRQSKAAGRDLKLRESQSSEKWLNLATAWERERTWSFS